MNGPAIEAKDQLNALILEAINAWRNYKKRCFLPSRISAGVTRATRSAQDQSRINVYCQLSGLEDVVMNDFIKDDLIPDGDEQGATGFAILLDPVALETEEQRIEREKNERAVFYAVGDYEVPPE